jgi:hypothetical protein
MSAAYMVRRTDTGDLHLKSTKNLLISQHHTTVIVNTKDRNTPLTSARVSVVTDPNGLEEGSYTNICVIIIDSNTRL